MDALKEKKTGFAQTRKKYAIETEDSVATEDSPEKSHRKSYSVNIGRISTHSTFSGIRNSRHNVIEVSENFKFEKNKLIYYQTLKQSLRLMLYKGTLAHLELFG